MRAGVSGPQAEARSKGIAVGRGRKGAERIRALARKELIQLRRDRMLARMLVLGPILQVLILGFAISRDPKHLDLVVRDLDRSRLSRRVIEALAVTETFDLSLHGTGPWKPEALLGSGQAKLLLTIPRHFERSLIRGRGPSLQLLVAGEDPAVAGIGSAYASQAALQAAARFLAEEGARQEAGGDVPFGSRVAFNPDLLSRYYTVPGIAGLLLIVITMSVTAMGIVREREAGTLEHLIVAPFRSHELMLGKVIPFAVLGLLEFAATLFVAWIVYRFPVRGDLLALLAGSVAFVLTMLGLGLFVSSIARTQQQALFMTWFATVFFILMSGFFFPVENMPPLLQEISRLDPVRYLMTMIRGVTLKGNGFRELQEEIGALVAFAAVALAAGSWRFRKALG